MPLLVFISHHLLLLMHLYTRHQNHLLLCTRCLQSRASLASPRSLLAHVYHQQRQDLTPPPPPPGGAPCTAFDLCEISITIQLVYLPPCTWSLQPCAVKQE